MPPKRKAPAPENILIKRSSRRIAAEKAEAFIKEQQRDNQKEE